MAAPRRVAPWNRTAQPLLHIEETSLPNHRLPPAPIRVSESAQVRQDERFLEVYI
jgi:hypothetical protein